MLMQCPCCSGLAYKLCCEPFLLGTEPPTALQLMRSRYSAYATGNVAYILKTTHPKSPHFDTNTARWRQNIAVFCRTTKFIRLEILGSGENWVSFAAHLEQNGKPIVLQEHSHFEQIKSHWRYVVGEVQTT